MNFRNFRKSFATISTQYTTTSYGDDEKENSDYACKLLQGGEHCDSGGGNDDGDGAPRYRRFAEKGEKKEEVVNVEKPRRNLKRRCIDSNRRLSYSTADLQGTSRLVDIRRYCPAILPPPLFTPSVTRAQKCSSPLKKCPLSPPPTSSLLRMCTHYLV